MKDTVNATTCDLCGARVQSCSFRKHRGSKQCLEMAQHREDVKRDWRAQYAKINRKP